MNDLAEDVLETVEQLLMDPNKHVIECEVICEEGTIPSTSGWCLKAPTGKIVLKIAYIDDKVSDAFESRRKGLDG